MKNIIEFFRKFKDNIGEPPWGGFSRVRRGAEQFSKHPSTIKQKRCRNDKKMTSALWSFFESGVQDFCARIIQDEIGEPPWDYNFLQNLDEKEYPRYLAKLFYLNTGEKLPLKWDFRNQAWVIDKKRCKTFNQKIQWLKLYGVTDLMRMCTDKVAVRDYVAEKIGEEYLKPVLQIIGNCSPSTSGRGRGEGIPLAENDVSSYFDQINWEKLPQAFVIKCNHGCKWHYIIKDKDLFLQNKRLIEIVKKQMTGWLEQDYSFWGGFEMQYRASLRLKPQGSLSDTKRIIEGEINMPVYINQYELRKGCQEKGIEPQILIEPYLPASRYIQIYCFNGIPQIYANIHLKGELAICTYNKDFSYSDFILKKEDYEFMCVIEADNILKQTIDLSKKLIKNFKFVRVDWMLTSDDVLYFEELTFTPYSGFSQFDKNWNKKLGDWIEI